MRFNPGCGLLSIRPCATLSDARHRLLKLHVTRIMTPKRRDLQVNSKHSAGVSICGCAYVCSSGPIVFRSGISAIDIDTIVDHWLCRYLAKYRPFAPGLLSQTWEPRFFTLNGSALQVGQDIISVLLWLPRATQSSSIRMTI